MFSKAKGSTNRAGKGQAIVHHTPSLLSNDLTVEGNLVTDGELHIEGIVNGDVTCGILTVGDKACITGEILAERVTIRGEIRGRVRARTVQLGKSAKVVGDVWHHDLSIDSGALLEGHCKRVDDTSEWKKSPAAAPLDTAAKEIAEHLERTSVAHRKPIDPVVVKKIAAG